MACAVSNGHVIDDVTWPSYIKMQISGKWFETSNDDVINVVIWPWKVKVMTPISLRPVISKTARDRDSALGTYKKWHVLYQMVTWPMTSFDPERLSRDLVIFGWKYLENGNKYPLMGNGLWRIEWWRHWWRHVTFKGQCRYPNIFKAPYFNNGMR